MLRCCSSVYSSVKSIRQDGIIESNSIKMHPYIKVGIQDSLDLIFNSTRSKAEEMLVFFKFESSPDWWQNPSFRTNGLTQSGFAFQAETRNFHWLNKFIFLFFAWRYVFSNSHGWNSWQCQTISRCGLKDINSLYVDWSKYSSANTYLMTGMIQHTTHHSWQQHVRFLYPNHFYWTKLIVMFSIWEIMPAITSRLVWGINSWCRSYLVACDMFQLLKNSSVARPN